MGSNTDTLQRVYLMHFDPQNGHIRQFFVLNIFVFFNKAIVVFWYGWLRVTFMSFWGYTSQGDGG
jgi:hypothetical protein